MDWKQYEEEILRHFRDEFPNAKITGNAKVVGRLSKVERQVDVLIDDTLAGFSIRIAIDAKHRGRPIDVADVEAFVGFCSDVDSNKGLMISLNGFTPAAINRAHNDESDIELDVLNFEELRKFQAFLALPYSGKFGVVLPAPFGWVIDGSRTNFAVATLYQRGRDIQDAGRAREWMYVNFWAKDDKASSIDSLTQHQESYLREQFPNATYSYRDGPQREHLQPTRIRRFVEASYPSLECTGYVEFDGFIFFCVLFTPVELEKRNLRKLEFILRSVMPFNVVQAQPNKSPQPDAPKSGAPLG